MFHVKNHKQLHIFDPWGHIGPKRLKLLEDSWSGLFRKEILTELPVEALKKQYHASDGRPTKELSSMIGLMILQQMHDLTDEEAVEQFCFNIQWQYALDITNGSDAYSYVSLKSLWTMRHLLSEEGLQHVLFDTVSQKLANVFKVDFQHQRIDSVHIQSNMRHLGRISLFAKTIRKFLTNLKRHHKNLLLPLDDVLFNRYLGKKQEAAFAVVKPSESHATLSQLAQDLYTLIREFNGIHAVESMSSYKLLVRLFNEQCVLQETNGDKIAVAKANKDVPSDSLQNPSDPDAGYSGHKGKGYQVQVMETYDPESLPESLSLITHVDVESADKSDANALLPAIEQSGSKGMAPQELLADSLYGGDDNCELAKTEYGVETIAPVMGKPPKGLGLEDFTLDDGGRIITCPQGCSPIKMKRKKRFNAVFPLDNCQDCPLQADCPVDLGKKAAYLRYSAKDARLAARRSYERTATFMAKYRFRAGVEATMSEYDRRTGVKKLRVRGMRAVSFAAVIKAIGVNIRRAAVCQKRRNRLSRLSQRLQRGTICLFLRVKDHLMSKCNAILTWPGKMYLIEYLNLKIAA